MKRLFASGLVFAFALAANASELYWQIGKGAGGDAQASWPVAAPSGSGGIVADISDDPTWPAGLGAIHVSVRSFYEEMKRAEACVAASSAAIPKAAERQIAAYSFAGPMGVVPEPASGLLTLLGLMAMGLMRKNVRPGY